MRGSSCSGSGRSSRRLGVYRESSAPASPPIEGRELPRLVLQLGGGDSDLALYDSPVLCVYPALGTDAADEQDEMRAAEWARKADALPRLRRRLIAASGDRLTDQSRWQVDTAPSYTVLNDPRFELARSLGLRTTRRGGRRVYEPATLIVERKRVVKVFSASAEVTDVWAWLTRRDP